jgi:hypothetical protein
MSDLTLTEQKHVRTVLRHLRRRVGTWATVAEALHFAPDTVRKVIGERDPVTASMAFRVARLAGVSVDDLLAGTALPGACPRCGFVLDFADEETVVEDGPCPPCPAMDSGLKLVK